MGALATSVRTRLDHHFRLMQSRKTTDSFQILCDEAFYERPIAERHRIIFYLGHGGVRLNPGPAGVWPEAISSH
jgi:hypothetical protein